jgi:hypothetical protein
MEGKHQKYRGDTCARSAWIGCLIIATSCFAQRPSSLYDIKDVDTCAKIWTVGGGCPEGNYMIQKLDGSVWWVRTENSDEDAKILVTQKLYAGYKKIKRTPVDSVLNLIELGKGKKINANQIP